MSELTDFTTKQAAQYCRLTRAGFVYHLQQGHVESDYTIGRNLMFKKSTLDAFYKTRRSAAAGRQKEV